MLIEVILVGLVAGLIGTVALTAFEQLDIAVTHREPSTVPGQVGAALLGRGSDEASVNRLNPVVHWAHGIGLGAVRGLLDLVGLGAVVATVVFYVIVWAGDALLYTVLRITPPPWRWEGAQLVRDLAGKGVYAVATSAAYVALRGLL